MNILSSVLSLTGGSAANLLIAAVGFTGVIGFSYNHGKTVMEGKMADELSEMNERLERLADNYVQLTVNMQSEHYEELDRAAAQARSIVEASELFFDASEAAREETRRSVEAYKDELREITERNETFKRQLEEQYDEWLKNETPFGVVCDTYRGVLDIKACGS
jgi:hypothetical protein